MLSTSRSFKSSKSKDRKAFKDFLYFLLLITLAPHTLLASETSPYMNLYELRLERLNAFNKFESKSLLGQKSIWISFQPQCISCKKQLNSLSCIPTEVKTIALGINGSRQKLKKVFQPIKDKKIIPLKANTPLINNLGLKITPSIYLVNKTGLIKKAFYGRQDCEKIKLELDKI